MNQRIFRISLSDPGPWETYSPHPVLLRRRLSSRTGNTGPREAVIPENAAVIPRILFIFTSEKGKRYLAVFQRAIPCRIGV